MKTLAEIYRSLVAVDGLGPSSAKEMALIEHKRLVRLEIERERTAREKERTRALCAFFDTFTERVPRG